MSEMSSQPTPSAACWQTASELTVAVRERARPWFEAVLGELEETR